MRGTGDHHRWRRIIPCPMCGGKAHASRMEGRYFIGNGLTPDGKLRHVKGLGHAARIQCARCGLRLEDANVSADHGEALRNQIREWNRICNGHPKYKGLRRQVEEERNARNSGKRG